MNLQKNQTELRELEAKCENWCPFLDKYAEERISEEKSKSIGKEWVVKNEYNLLEKLFQFLNEEKGLDCLDELFFDEDNLDTLEQFLRSLSSHSKYDVCHAMARFFGFCSKKYAPISKSRQRKAQALRLEAMVGKHKKNYDSSFSKRPIILSGEMLKDSVDENNNVNYFIPFLF